MTDAQTLIAIAKTAKSFREATGIPSAVFHATVRGNIEQGYYAHIAEMVAAAAKRGEDTSELASVSFHDVWTWDGSLETMYYHHEAKELAKSVPEIL